MRKDLHSSKMTLFDLCNLQNCTRIPGHHLLSMLPLLMLQLVIAQLLTVAFGGGLKHTPSDGLSSMRWRCSSLGGQSIDHAHAQINSYATRTLAHPEVQKALEEV